MVLSASRRAIVITLKEMALEAGVSISTVSKALNNSTDISTATRDKILKLAKERKYTKKTKQPNGQYNREKQVVAVIYSDIVSRYYTMILKEFNARLTEMGALMLMSSAHFETANINEFCQFYTKTGVVDGIVILSASNIFGDVPACGLPMVGISYPSTEYHDFDHICVDDATGIYDGLKALKKLGHKNIAYIGERYTWYRRQYFEQAMKDLHLEVQEKYIIENDLRFEKAGQKAMESLLALDEKPTAIFAAYDDMAAGAFQVMSEEGFRVPEDFSLCGIDATKREIGRNQEIASVNCHIEAQVDTALNILFRKIDRLSSTETVQNISLKTQFNMTGTIGPVRKHNL